MICNQCGKNKRCKPFFMRGHAGMYCSEKCLIEFAKTHNVDLGAEVMQFNFFIDKNDHVE
jgi:hypothetical protein